MSSLRATRLASSTASREQHLFCTTRSTPSSSVTPGSDHRRSIMPITSWPSSLSSAAATELSTPPLIATTILAMVSAPEMYMLMYPINLYRKMTSRGASLRMLCRPTFLRVLVSSALSCHVKSSIESLYCQIAPSSFIYCHPGQHLGLTAGVDSKVDMEYRLDD